MPRKSAAELKADLEKTLSVLEPPVAPPTPPEPPVEVKKEEPAPVTPPVTPPVVAPPIEQPSVEKPKSEEPDYKKKFVDSTREAQILASRNRKMTEVLEQADQLPDPTPEELKAQFPDWELIDPVQQTLIKDSIKNKKIISMLGQATKEARDIEAWNAKVDEFVDDPKTLVQYPDLEGKQDDLKVYATKATRRGVDFQDIVSSFLFTEAKSRPKNKGAMFQAPTPGPSVAPKPASDKISITEAMELKKTNYRKYKELLVARKIDMGSIE